MKVVYVPHTVKQIKTIWRTSHGEERGENGKMAANLVPGLIGCRFFSFHPLS